MRIFCLLALENTECPIISDTIFRRNISFHKGIYILKNARYHFKADIFKFFFFFFFFCLFEDTTLCCLIPLKFSKGPKVLYIYEKTSVYGHFRSKLKFLTFTLFTRH